jgi:hypothetical protein
MGTTAVTGRLRSHDGTVNRFAGESAGGIDIRAFGDRVSRKAQRRACAEQYSVKISNSEDIGAHSEHLATA